MNYIYSFIIFEAGAFFGFFVAALLNAARAGQEITIKFEEEDNGAELPVWMVFSGTLRRRKWQRLYR